MEKKVQITVAFLSSRKPSADETADDEDEDEDDDDDFDFSTSGVKSKLPDKRIVEMKVLNTGATVHVKCRLPWTWSWLQATIELRYPVSYGKSSEVQQLIDGKFKVIQCHLDPSQGHNGVTAIALFLKDVASCSDGEEKNNSNAEVGEHFQEYKTQFCTWLGHLPSRSVSLAQLEQLMNQYEEESVSRNNVQVSLFRQQMARSVAGQVFCMATNQPTFFRAAPILFPRKILSLMVFPADDISEIRRKQKLHDILEKVAVEYPWKFGFSEVMYKETHASGLEAPLFAMRSAWFYPSLSDLHKTALQTYDMFKAECKSKGHTFLLHNNLPLHFSFYSRDRERKTKDEEIGPPSNTETYSAVEFLIEQEILRREVRGAEERFHLMKYWKAEEGIVSALEGVMLSPDWVLEVDLTQETFARIQGDLSQMAAARCIVNKPVTIISGRGGTGKTEVVSAVLKVAEGLMKDVNKHEEGEKCDDNSLISEDGVNSDDSIMTADNTAHNQSKVPEETDNSNGPILYCAPTGKAASVIKKRVGSKAFTIHQVLASYKLWRNGEQSNPWKFGATRIVAVDECSMVSIEIFHFLLKYLLEGSKLGKVVLLGDHLQLPSVDPGNFMEDLFLALQPRGNTVTLTTNHRSEGSIIFSNATKISKQMMPIFDADQGFRLIIPEKDNINSVPSSARAGCSKLGFASAQLLQTVKGRGRDPEQDKLELYWSLLRQHRQKFSIEDDEKSQIISFLNNECYALNQFGCFVYNKHLMFASEGRKMRKQFDVGDKIICTKNSDIPIFVDENSEKVTDGDEPVVQNDTDTDSVSYTIASDGKYEEPPGLKLKSKNERLMNGNLYKIRAICRANVTSTASPNDTTVDTNNTVAEKAEEGESVTVSREYYVLDDLAGDIIRANPEMLQKKTKISHAWALSIHKFQGSEADTIVYGLSGSNYESWKHVYTAVTRGRKDVVIVGSYQDLEKAVKKKPTKRQTALTEKVKKMYSGLAKKKEERRKVAEEDDFPEDETENVAKKGRRKKDKPEKGANKGRKTEDTSMSPSKKLSQILENSLSLDWGQEDSLFREVCDARKGGDSDSDQDGNIVLSRDLTDISPNKRKTIRGEGAQVPHKQVRNLSQKGWGLDETAFSFQSPLASLKRQAADSPATYQRSCVAQSPATYQVSRNQPGGEEGGLQDSFIDLDCSQLEREAIASSQRDFCRSMMTNVFGSDDEDEEHAEFEELFEKTEKDDYLNQTNS